MSLNKCGCRILLFAWLAYMAIAALSTPHPAFLVLALLAASSLGWYAGLEQARNE